VHLSVRSLRERQVGDARLASLVLLASVFAVLLLASTNVATRAAVRQCETAVRVALGATTARLARQAVTESMLLSLAGAVAGCWVASLLRCSDLQNLTFLTLARITLHVAERFFTR
jgi:putative ABC transport system permease protein